MGEKRVNPLIKTYLLLYNAGQFLGWSFVMYLAVTHYANTGCYKGMFEAVKWPLLIFQTGALLEIAHAAVGFVKSNVFVTGFQVWSRVFLAWPILFVVPEAAQSIGFPLLLVAWTVTEIVRYAFYFLSLVGAVPYALLWIRYTFFIALYPIGITGELICCYAALPYYGETGNLSIRMPNMINQTFDFYYFIVLTMLGYIPVFPQLYLYMFGQRKKVIGGGGTAGHAKKK